MSARQAWLAARRGVDEAEGVHAAMPVSMPALGRVFDIVEGRGNQEAFEEAVQELGASKPLVFVEGCTGVAVGPFARVGGTGCRLPCAG